MRYVLSLLITAFCLAAATPAVAQQEGIHWHHDLESAKAMAKSTGRLVLVHFWAPTCGPCMALEQNVFNQPGVGPALEAQYVPVKLNADENSATAQSFGVSRIPTDVVITPEGQIVGKLVSPSTPMAYVADVTKIAKDYATRSGHAYDVAAANAPARPQLNAAYANLQVAPTTPLAVVQPSSDATQQRGSLAAFGGTTPPATPQFGGGFAPNTGSTVAPQVVNNPAAVAPANAPPITPIGAPPAAMIGSMPAGAPVGQVQNPYMNLGVPAVPNAPMPPAVQPAAPAVPNYGATAGMNPAAAPFAAPTAAAPAMPAASVPAGAPDMSKLPAGSPPLGFDGYCPVTMRNTWKWVPGNPQFGVVHRGRTYWFTGPEEQKQFWADPDRYAPALSGMDPVLALDHKQNVPGKREHSLDYDGLFYMFASEATLQQFTANPQRYAASARQAMGIPRGRLVR